jgi:predicted nucleic acid-binding protein
MIYLLDSNTISDWITANTNVTANVEKRIMQGDVLGICQPIIYEAERGFRWRPQARKEQVFREKLLPLLTTISVLDADWLLAAQFWADTVSRGKQLSDIDLLLAALAHRLNAVIVSNDSDFDPLPIKRENWR